MSNAHHPGPHEHESFIRTPRQLVWLVLLAFVVPVLMIIGIAACVDSSTRSGAGSALYDEASVQRRLEPVAKVDFRDASGPVALRTGEQVYQGQCAACHATGAAGSPKAGDAAAWGPRIGQGFETLRTHALKGFNAMPPQAGGEFSDYEIGRAVVYLANQGGAKFAEPPAPAASGAASAASAP